MNKKVFPLLIVAAIAVFMYSLPIVMDLNIYNTDGQFFLARVEGVTDAINHKKIYNLNTNFYYGTMYATNLFYSNISFVPIALFGNGLGLSTIQIAKLIILSYYCIGILIVYYSSRKLFEYKSSDVQLNRILALAITIVYMLDMYRVFNSYYRGAMGEYIASSFMPLLVLGIYELMYTKEMKKRHFIIGMVGLIFSHLLSCLIIFNVYMLYLFIYCMRNYQNKKKILRLLKKLAVSSIIIIGISAVFFLPLLENMTFLKYNTYTQPYDSNGLGLSTLKNYVSVNMYSAYILIIYIIILFQIIVTKGKEKFLVDSMIVVTYLFGMLEGIIPIYLSFGLSSIQFIFRLLGIATVILILALSYLLLDYMKRGKEKRMFSFYVIFVLFVTGGLQLSIYHNGEDIKNENKEIAIANLSNDVVNPIGNEYVPAAHFDYKKLGELVSEKDKYAISYDKITVYDVPKSEEILIPQIPYKGLTFMNDEKGTLRPDSKSGLTQIKMDKDYSEVVIQYKGTTLQKVSTIISIISIVGALLYKFYSRIKV